MVGRTQPKLRVVALHQIVPFGRLWIHNLQSTIVKTVETGIDTQRQVIFAAKAKVARPAWAHPQLPFVFRIKLEDECQTPT